MTNWRKRIKIKHLLTGDPSHAAVQACMNAIKKVLDQELPAFEDKDEFANIPFGDDPQDYANRLLAKMYDFCDYHRIWID